ncbi:MAG: hypothetical protein IJ876_00235 [Elusimicrobiaceae bacterium]|nr:hypothetical protein [Elusimicrobiaceae bacterium]
MEETLQERIFNVGLIAGIPAASEDRTLNAIKALRVGEIHAVIFPWNKQLLPMLGKIRITFPKVLIGVQGPWAQVSDALELGADFVASDLPEGEKDARCFKREGNALLTSDQKEIAQCNNKLVFAADLHKGAWDIITQRAHAAIEEMLGFNLRHVGINHANEKEATQTADFFEKTFGFTKEDKGGAYFAATYIEAMKKPFHGMHGHIAIATNNAARAAWYLQQRGTALNWKTADYTDGILRVIYLQDEVAGFAVHIVQK